MSSRRFVIAALLASPFTAFPNVESAAVDNCRAALLRPAMRAAGGERLLRSVRLLKWRGTAKIFAGDRIVQIGVATQVTPFQSARSDTWLLSDGPNKKRSLILEGEQGWLERDGQRTPMPEPMRVHERQQYSIYGLMLLADDCARRSLKSTLPALENLYGVEVHHDAAPVTTLYFDRNNRLAAATNRVNDPDDTQKTQIEQRFEFSGEIIDGGIRWPRALKIWQNEKPYFELTLSEFAVEAR